MICAISLALDLFRVLAAFPVTIRVLVLIIQIVNGQQHFGRTIRRHVFGMLIGHMPDRDVANTTHKEPVKNVVITIGHELTEHSAQLPGQISTKLLVVSVLEKVSTQVQAKMIQARVEVLHPFQIKKNLSHRICKPQR